MIHTYVIYIYTYTYMFILITPISSPLLPSNSNPSYEYIIGLTGVSRASCTVLLKASSGKS